MLEFWNAVANFPLARNALIMCVLASISCGIVGSYVVTRRVTYIAASIAHCVLAGLGGARYLNVVHGWDSIQPLHGAFAAALIAAMLIGVITLYGREREDSVIGAVWAVGMAIGILFIYKTPGYNQDLMSYLFGSILLVTTEELWLVAVWDAVVLAMAFALFAELQAVTFDEEFARLRGLPVRLYYFLLLGVTAVTVVLLVTVVGIVLVIALLTIPVAAAGKFARSFSQLMAVSSLFCAVFTVGGLSISYGPDLPPGPTIIVVAAICYLAALLARFRGATK